MMKPLKCATSFTEWSYEAKNLNCKIFLFLLGTLLSFKYILNAKQIH